MQRYLEAVWMSVKPLYVLFGTAVSYVMFPNETYKGAAIALVCAVIMDIITKYYALSKKNGGLWKAIHDGHIRSNDLWQGTSRKIFIYLVLMILTGLSVRVSPIEQIAVFASTFVYALCFTRECISCIENIIYANPKENSWLKVFLVMLKRKQKEMIDEYNKKEEK
jgi:hypothetical protein